MDDNGGEGQVYEEKEKVTENHNNENRNEVSKEKGIKPRKPYVMTEARKKALEKANEKKAQNNEIRRKVEEKYNKIKEDLQTVYDYNLIKLEKPPEETPQIPPQPPCKTMVPKIEKKSKEKKKKISKPPPPSSSSEEESGSEIESEDEGSQSSLSDDCSESEEEIPPPKRNRKADKSKKVSRNIKRVKYVQPPPPPPPVFRSTGSLPRTFQRGF